MIVEGKICICDECGRDDPRGRWVYEEGDENRLRCKNRKCRSYHWNTGGKDWRTWVRVPPNSIPPAQR